MEKETEQFLMELQKEIKAAPKLYWRFKKLLAKLEKLEKQKEFVINIYKQHIENKWNWSDGDVAGMVRRSLISDEDFEQALKEGG